MECEDTTNASMEAVARPHDELDYDEELPQEANQQYEPSSSIVDGSKDDEIEEGEVEDEPVVSEVESKKPCYFFKMGKCTWGRQCKFLHPGTNDTGAYQLIPDRGETAVNFGKDAVGNEKADASNGAPVEQCRWAPEAVYPRTAAESAWEEGLRHARQMRQRAEQRRLQDKDFADKRLNLRVKDVREGAEEQDEEVVIARKAHAETQRPNVEKFCPPSLAIRSAMPRERSLSAEFEPIHSNFYDYKSKRSRAYHKTSRGSPRRHSFRKDYKSQGAYNADAEWHDPWSRRPTNRRARAPSTDSSSTRSRSCSSSASASSFSSQSSYTSSRSCSSGSSPRYRRRRRSPSVKRSRPSSPSALRSVVVPAVSAARDRRNSSLRSSPTKPTTDEPTGVQPFKPGRQISSHTLKKAEREGKMEEASQFSSDDDGSSRLSSRDSSPLSFSSTESSSCRSSEILAPTTIGAQAAATRLANSRLRKEPGTRDTMRSVTPNANRDSVLSTATKTGQSDNNMPKSDDGDQGKAVQRQTTSEQKAVLIKQLKEVEAEIERKRKHKK